MKEKMALTLYHVDAFASGLFRGNPAGVCILEDWLPDDLMQNIAAENFLPETAFAVKQGDLFHIRYFAPEAEVELCGHATLATAHVLFNHLGFGGDCIDFLALKAGELQVERSGELLIMDFPADEVMEIAVSPLAEQAFGKRPVRAFKGKTDFLLVFQEQDAIEKMEPDFDLVEKIGGRGTIVTAPGNQVDFVSRFFAPQLGIREDPVTGSAHTTLIPYWSEVLGKKKMEARQLSARGGELGCEQGDGRVKISGKAITYLVGELTL